MDNRNSLWRHVDAQKERLIELSDRVWGMPEICYTEARSAAEHVAELRHQGFRVTARVAGIPPAVIGEAGAGGPVIAVRGAAAARPPEPAGAGRPPADSRGAEARRRPRRCGG